MAWLAGLAAVEGRRSGMAAVAGVALGLLLNGVLAALGLAALLSAAPSLWSVLRLAGAGMMLWLAWETWRSADETGDRQGDNTAGRSFAAGAMVNLLNPKAYLFFVVVAPQFLNGRALNLSNALILALVSSSVATAIHTAIVLAGSRAQGWLSDPGRITVVRRVFAVLMIGVAGSFLLPLLR